MPQWRGAKRPQSGDKRSWLYVLMALTIYKANRPDWPEKMAQTVALSFNYGRQGLLFRIAALTIRTRISYQARQCQEKWSLLPSQSGTAQKKSVGNSNLDEFGRTMATLSYCTQV